MIKSIVDLPIERDESLILLTPNEYINIDVANIMDFSVEFYETVVGRSPVREFLDETQGKRSR